MINPQELRLGNLILDTVRNRVVTVTGIHKEHVNVDDYALQVEDIGGIELSASDR